MDAKKQSYRVAVVEEDITFLCAENETVLEAMVRSGKGPLRCGCFGGGCGICKMQIVAGKTCQRAKMSRAHVSETEQDMGILLICCVEPRSDLVLKKI